jgi:hypothetical protein
MIIASIDPGAESGIVIVALSEKAQTIFRSVQSGRQSMYSLDHARLVATYVIKTLGAANGRSASQRRAPLFEKMRQYFVQHDVDEVVIERPSDIILGGFKSAKRKKAGEGIGTAFGLGNHFGLIEAAALDADVDRITCYQIRTHSNEMGWMQRREKKCPARELTLQRARARMKDLAQRPYNGIITPVTAGSTLDNENVLMALGVLEFHCDRERGRV